MLRAAWLAAGRTGAWAPPATATAAAEACLPAVVSSRLAAAPWSARAYTSPSEAAGQGPDSTPATTSSSSSSSSSSSGEGEGVPSTRPLNLCNAINEALHIALDTNERTLVFGEDVAFGGVFRCTAGLLERHGRHRVFNTPLCEQGILGFGIGAATEGFTAVAEIQFADYIYPAFDQLVNEAAKYRYRSGSMFDCGGLTVRTPCGAVGHGGHYHSQSPEAIFTGVPGLTVVMPSSPGEAKGLLLAAIRSPDPVVFFEPKMLYRTAVEEVPVGDYMLPLGEARCVRPGSDVTLVTWGAQVLVAQQAAERAAAQHGISCEVLDLRTLLPWDREAVAASVAKTGRLIVTHEAPVTSGFGAEVVAAIVGHNKTFLKLEAPPLRVCGQDTPFPLVFEPLYLPGVERLLEAVVATAQY